MDRHADAPTLPPLLRLATPPAGAAPLDHARAIAAQAGAGTLVWAPHPRLLRLAVVLEPEGALAQARLAFFAAMAALGDALAMHCPPERLVAFGWPDAVLFDAGRIGAAQLAWPEGCAEDDAPAWIVFAATLTRRRPPDAIGRAPGETTLEEEGFDPDRDIVESFARYLMLWADRWAAEGFGPIADSYLARLADGGPGARLGADGALTAPGAAPRALAALAP